MAATIRFNDDEIPAVTRGFIKTIDRDNWHKVAPFWYKKNQYGTWEVYTTEELSNICENSLLTKEDEKEHNRKIQRIPKNHALLIQSMIINHG